jgi:hypothetical protein
MSRSDARRRVSLLWAALCLAAAAPGGAATLLGGRLRLAGEATGTIAPEDEGYFNYSDYQTSHLRLFRLDLAAEAVLAPVASVLVDVRSDNLHAPRVYALYLRLARRDGRLALQAGLVPPVFGAYPRRRYAYDNPLPSVPLVYQYLTTMRYDAVPASAEQIVAQRGRGWLVRYPVGAASPEPGLPVVNAERWDAGLQLRLGREPLSLSLALTQGSPSHPLVSDDNDGKQLSARVQWRPGPSLTAGVSAASAEFLTRDLVAVLPQEARRGYRQDAAGIDLEWERGYWIVRAEGVWSRWALPALDATRIESPLASLGGYAELRYRIRPGLFAAARLERLGFAPLDSSLGRQAWEAPVTRVEAGLGYTLRRHVLLKASWQHNSRDGGKVRRNDLVAAQVLLWF